MSFIYMASPYSHSDHEVMRERYLLACEGAAMLMELGYAVFAPIAHSHPIADCLDPKLRTDFEFWMSQDLPVLAAADKMVILTLDGWRESRGVARETQFCKQYSKPIQYFCLEKGFLHDAPR